MRKIASPQDLQDELRTLFAYVANTDRPSREVVARVLLDLAERTATDFPTQEALDEYLKSHPKADKGKHRVVDKEKAKADKAEGKAKGKVEKEEKAKLEDERRKEKGRKIEENQATQKGLYQEMAKHDRGTPEWKKLKNKLDSAMFDYKNLTTSWYDR